MDPLPIQAASPSPYSTYIILAKKMGSGRKGEGRTEERALYR